MSPGSTAEISAVEARCPTFSWSTSPSAVRYEVVVYRVGPGWEDAEPVIRRAFDGSVSSWTPPLSDCLERGGRYGWSVRAGLAAHEPADVWSAPSLFEVAAAPSQAELEAALEVVRQHLARSEDRATAASAATPRGSQGSAPGRRPEPVASPPAPESTRLRVDGNIQAASFTGDGSSLDGVATDAELDQHAAAADAHHAPYSDAEALAAVGPHTVDTTCHGAACDGSQFTGVDAELLDGLDATAFALSLAGQECPTGQSVTGFDGAGQIVCGPPFTSCREIKDSQPAAVDGVFTIDPDGPGAVAPFDVHCDMTTDGGGWTLVARFANVDDANWMLDTGEWWYSRTAAAGDPASRSQNLDMYSPAFHTVTGDEIKISRTDNPDDLGLLVTTASCLGDRTFRAFITSFGDFRNGATWGTNSVAGTCAASLGNNYASTVGFSQADCTGELGQPSSISFWADWSAGDGSVMMIGGGGSSCDRADHGIGVTEANEASFIFPTETDFGDSATDADEPYALNLWVR